MSLDMKGGTSEANSTTSTAAEAANAGTKQSLFINLAARGADLSAEADTGGALKASDGSSDSLIWYVLAGLGLALAAAAAFKKKS